jgi:hypothetical protein
MFAVFRPGAFGGPVFLRSPHRDHMVSDDIRSIVERLRARDRAEVLEYGVAAELVAQLFAGPCVLGRVFAYDELPAAVVAFHALTPKALSVAMVATDDWPHVARAVVRWGVRQAIPALVADGFTRAECRTMDGHAEAIRLLERMGFRLECRLHGFGASGAAFLQYAWRLEDHPLVRCFAPRANGAVH